MIVWLGSGTTLALAGAFARRDGGGLRIPQVAALGEWLGPRVFAPASLAVLVGGILLVVDGSWSFDPLWIKLGLTAFAASFLTNVLLRLPTVRRLERAVRESGPKAAEVARAGRRLGAVARLDLAVLYLAVADMIAKPTADDVWTLVVGGAILALAGLSVVVGERRSEAR